MTVVGGPHWCPSLYPPDVSETPQGLFPRGLRGPHATAITRWRGSARILECAMHLSELKHAHETETQYIARSSINMARDTDEDMTTGRLSTVHHTKSTYETHPRQCSLVRLQDDPACSPRERSTGFRQHCQVASTTAPYMSGLSKQPRPLNLLATMGSLPLLATGVGTCPLPCPGTLVVREALGPQRARASRTR